MQKRLGIGDSSPALSSKAGLGQSLAGCEEGGLALGKNRGSQCDVIGGGMGSSWGLTGREEWGRVQNVRSGDPMTRESVKGGKGGAWLQKGQLGPHQLQALESAEETDKYNVEFSSQRAGGALLGFVGQVGFMHGWP